MVETPQKGETLKASWAASVARAVNDSSPMGAAGFLARDGVTGRGFEALPQNRRERKAAAASTVPSPFTVRTSVVTQESTDGSEATKKLKVEMYSRANYLVNVNNDTLTSWKEAETDTESESESSEEQKAFGKVDGWVTVGTCDVKAATVWLHLKLCVAVLAIESPYHRLFDAANSLGEIVVKEGSSAPKESGLGFTQEAATLSGKRTSNELGKRTFEKYYRVASIGSSGEVTCQDIVGTMNFLDLLPSVAAGDDTNLVLATTATNKHMTLDVYYK